MYNNIYTALCEKLEEYDKRGGDMSANDLEYIHILTDSIKNLDKIERLNEDYRGDSYRNESYRNYRGSYDDGMSSRTRVSGYYRDSRNRRNSYADGRMSNDSYRGSYDNSYYRDGSYDNSYAETVEQLKMLMQIADDKEKKALKHAISQIESGQ